MYEYRATILRVIDGDTVACRVDLGCDVRIDLTIRLFGINAPELSTEAGKAARAWLVDRLAFADNLATLRTVKDRREKYGRYLGTLLTPSFGVLTDLNAQMVEAGHAVAYLP